VNLKKSIRDFFGVSHREANGLLVLAAFLIALILSEPLAEWWLTSREQDYAEEKKALDSLIALWPTEELPKEAKPTSPGTATLRPFNPNNAAKEDLISVGFPEFLAARIINFRNKGGKFKVKNDLSKIYGLKPEQYAAFKPYIQLPDSFPSASKHSKYAKEKTPPPAAFGKKNTPLPRIDINACDTADLRKVYGVGSKLSNRIILFRNKLGGFVRLNQLSEVYGLDSSVINKIKKIFFVDGKLKPALLKINSMTEKELGQHPYVGYKKAQQICAYRRQHGNYASLEELKKNPLVTDEAFEKMKPYLSLE